MRWLLAPMLLISSGCAAYSTPAIKMNAAFIEDGTKVVVGDFKEALAAGAGIAAEKVAALMPLLEDLANAAEVNTSAVKAPDARLNVNDREAVQANTKQAEADVEQGSHGLAWLLGGGAMLAGLFGGGWVQRKLSKAAERAATAPT